ncbi:type II toxin-antitoxin system RelE/ParE family toxin [Brevundimonas alba]|uniref:type II toxin-antitoxin system RelE/ParE family toxin n=1 Tax=Brevundimonas alba TaxID=74314 RepID=UPI00143CB3BF|nr:type II toxin-antitoxin system RelE/ParE family toxin [Brevundimonas alba]
MRRLIWSTDAIDDLRAIRSYIAETNPLAASRVAARLVDTANALGAFPDRGRPVRSGLRELTSAPPYIIRYVVLPDEVRIAFIRHAARRPEP